MKVVHTRKNAKNQKTALCLGHTDEAIDADTGRLVGYIGFHEYDGYIEIMELRNREKEIARKFGIDITALKTGKGYHFVSFTIMRRGRREEFAKTMQKVFPSNYLQNAKHRVLRLGKKGSHMKPKFLSCYFRLPETKKRRYLSSSHMETYVNEGIIPKEVIEELMEHNGGNVRRTSETLCLYPAWIPKNMRAASLERMNVLGVQKEALLVVTLVPRVVCYLTVDGLPQAFVEFGSSAVVPS